MGITRYVLPVVIGAMSGMILISLGEMWIETIYPLPPGTDKYDVVSLAKAIAAMPEHAFVLLLINYLAASFAAGVISTLVAKRNTVRPAFVVGIVLTLAGLYNVVSLPQPVWFSIAGLLVYIPFTYLGYRVVRKPSPENTGSGQNE
jgi:hypothetical protein